MAFDIEEPKALILARAYWDNKWPEQLVSGVMFYMGFRITRKMFEAKPVDKPCVFGDMGIDNSPLESDFLARRSVNKED